MPTILFPTQTTGQMGTITSLRKPVQDSDKKKKDALTQSVQVSKTCQGTGLSSMDERVGLNSKW